MKKKRKTALFLVPALVLALAAGGCSEKDESSQEEIEVQENQEVCYGVITSIDGNEITYTQVDSSAAEAMEEKQNENTGTENGEAAQMPSRDGTAENKEASAGSTAGESVSTVIPVGTVVHTSSGTETTFSRIKTGDLLKFLVETDEEGSQIIVELWMI